MFPRATRLAHDTLRDYARSRSRDPAFERAELYVRHFVSLYLAKCQRALTQAQIVAVENILREATIDVDQLAEIDLKLDLSIETLQRFDELAGAEVLGYAVPASRRIAICERAERYAPLYRATVLHEIGHVLLHSQRCYRGAAYSPESPRRPAQEREADAFMHAAILPDGVLFLGVVLLSSLHGLDFGSLMRRAFNRSPMGLWLWQYLILPGIVSRLCVSTELASIKLKSLGVFDQDSIEFHRRHSLPNKWMKPSDHKPIFHVMRAFARDIQTSHSATKGPRLKSRDTYPHPNPGV